jgi:N-acetylmuramoyl-L-alanine amidase
MLILHYTGMSTAEAALDRLCDPASEVSAHYLVEEDGTAWHLVPDDRRAWHAGRAFWAGETDINSRSIGIELANPGHEHGYRPFPDAQMTALEQLCQDVLSRFPIRSHLVLGHADIAPGRKLDPGELFDWQRLAAAGVGLWPEADGGPAGMLAESGDFAADMRRYGYENDSVEAVAAFQRHFRPAAVTGIADMETRGRLRNLIIQAGLA